MYIYIYINTCVCVSENGVCPQMAMNQVGNVMIIHWESGIAFIVQGVLKVGNPFQLQISTPTWSDDDWMSSASPISGNP